MLVQKIKIIFSKVSLVLIKSAIPTAELRIQTALYKIIPTSQVIYMNRKSYWLAKSRNQLDFSSPNILQ